jgi:S1-C subfamily serine protease
MSPVYFIQWQGRRSGPYEAEEVRLLYRTREIGAQAMVDCEGASQPVTSFIAGHAFEATDRQNKAGYSMSPRDASLVSSEISEAASVPSLAALSTKKNKARQKLFLPIAFVAAVGFSLLSLFFVPWLCLTLAAGLALALLLKKTFVPGCFVSALVLIFFAAHLWQPGKKESESEGAVFSNRPLELPELRAMVMPAVVQVLALNESGEVEKTGSGFFINNNLVVTNFHVVAGAYTVDFLLENESRSTCLAVVHSDQVSDLAILESAKNGRVYLGLEHQRVMEGERVAVIGSPLGLEGTLSEGIISAVRIDENEVELLQITAPISPGSSGSPVVNKFGKVVAIATMIHTGGQSLNFAVSGRELGPALERINLNTKTEKP